MRDEKLEEKNLSGNNNQALNRYLSPLAVWALSFGCAVGWGSFVMPGTTFLPLAGPWGTAIGMLIGGIVMLIIGTNYCYMVKRYPDCGGTYAYTKKTMGYDHGFISTWFLMLVYIAIVWANATALPLICRNLFGGLFQFGFKYTVAGYRVYFGEILLCICALTIATGICIMGGRYSALIQIIMAICLLGGIVLCGVLIFAGGSVHLTRLEPAFVPKGNRFLQIMEIVVLAPWAYVGFESVSHSAEEFNFKNNKHISVIIIISLISGVIAYSLLAFIAVSYVPEGYGNWSEYISDLGNLSGLEGLPTFNAARNYLGSFGLFIMGIAAMCGIMTGLVGNMIAVSRLIYSMARDNMMPERWTVLNKNGVPQNILIAIFLISLPIPFFGRTAIGWIIDVNTVGATIAFAYTSGAALRAAKKENYMPVRITGVVGFIISMAYTFYFLVPGFWSISVLATESYLIFICWSILGFVAFRYVYNRDKLRRFGKSTVVWLSLLFLIYFLTMLWFREATQETTAKVLANLNEYNNEELEEHGITLTGDEEKDAQYHLQKQVETVNNSMQINSTLQMATILIALFIMFSIYNSMMNREKNLEIQRVTAEENSKAKSVFLSNMSHDIRTPMNAIIGYTELAKDVANMPEEGQDYLQKIESSSQHLLALINDVLDMSRIESGKMELDIAKADLKIIMRDIKDIFDAQMALKHINYIVNVSNIKNRYVLCDSNRLNRVLLNLISNACKFTPEGGTVVVSLIQIFQGESRGSYQIRVKDSGMGMSAEFADKVFEAYERERSANNIQGTGLGMAIAKSIIDLMDGSIRVETEQGKGTEFIIDIDFPLVPESEIIAEENKSASKTTLDYSQVRLLLVDDQPVNREIAIRILRKFGFKVESAENGEEAVAKVLGSAPGYYQAVLMDIQMPVMNGYDATRTIRSSKNKELSDIPIVAMTANAFTEDIQAAKDAGMNSHISKPIDVNKMIETLNEILA